MKKVYYCWNENEYVLNNIYGFVIGNKLKALIQFKNETLLNRINHMINSDIPYIINLEKPLTFIEVTIDNNNIITDVNVLDNNLIKKLIAIHE